VPLLGSNGSANGTNVTTVTPLSPNSTVEPFVGAASEVFVGKYAAWMGSALVSFVVMAVLM
jgi:mannitol-specific phosphotransferase system IIBC component